MFRCSYDNLCSHFIRIRSGPTIKLLLLGHLLGVRPSMS